MKSMRISVKKKDETDETIEMIFVHDTNSVMDNMHALSVANIIKIYQ